MSDKHVQAVRDKMRDRERTGLRKYGVTTERTDLTTLDFGMHRARRWTLPFIWKC